MKCRDIIELLQQLSPPEYACEWDNVGLLVGHEEQEIHSIMIALDPSVEVVEEAVKKNIDLLITHHPMIFCPIKQVTDSSPLGAKILALAENHIAYFAMHTNFDIKGSMADLAANRLHLHNTQPLEITTEKDKISEGIGRVGDWETEITLEEVVNCVKREFHLDTVMVYGDLQQSLQRVAISPGSGKSMIGEAIEKNAQVLITGDIGHHEGLDAMEAGLAIVDATHYGLEYIFIDFIKDFLRKQGVQIEIYTCHTGCPCQFV